MIKIDARKPCQLTRFSGLTTRHQVSSEIIYNMDRIVKQPPATTGKSCRSIIEAMSRKVHHVF